MLNKIMKPSRVTFKVAIDEMMQLIYYLVILNVHVETSSMRKKEL